MPLAYFRRFSVDQKKLPVTGPPAPQSVLGPENGSEVGPLRRGQL